jgi:hypothetical protein
MSGTLISVIIAEDYGEEMNYGKCVPLMSWHEAGNTPLNGAHQIVCYDTLKNLGWTHYWVNHTEIPDGDPDGPCLTSSQYVFDSEAFSFSHIFTDNERDGPVPSTICQQSLITSVCLAKFKKCDPNIDIGEYISQPKVCRWFCNALADTTSDDALCNYQDQRFLASYGMSLSTVRLTCVDNDRYTDDDDDCIAPNTIVTRSMAPKCEEYKGTKCKSVFPNGSYVYLPPGLDQNYMESMIDFETPFLALPRDDNECKAAWTKLYCQIVYQTCLESGLKEFKVDELTGRPRYDLGGKPVDHAIPLRPQVNTCEHFEEVWYVYFFHFFLFFSFLSFFISFFHFLYLMNSKPNLFHSPIAPKLHFSNIRS